MIAADVRRAPAARPVARSASEAAKLRAASAAEAAAAKSREGLSALSRIAGSFAATDVPDSDDDVELSDDSDDSHGGRGRAGAGAAAGGRAGPAPQTRSGKAGAGAAAAAGAAGAAVAGPAPSAAAPTSAEDARRGTIVNVTVRMEGSDDFQFELGTESTLSCLLWALSVHIGKPADGLSLSYAGTKQPPTATLAQAVDGDMEEDEMEEEGVLFDAF